MSLQIGLSKKHANRLLKGKGFQLKPHELNGSGPHQYELELNPAVHRRLQHAMSYGKGFRIPKNVLYKALDLVKHAYRKSVPKELRDGLSNIVIDGKRLYHNARKGDIQEVLTNAKSLHHNLTDTYDKAKAVSGGKVGKGTQEARDKMARVRAMRTIHGGSTYAQRLARRTRNTFKPVEKGFKTVVNAVAPVAKIAFDKVIKPVGKDLLKKAVPMAITAGLTAIGAPEAAPIANAALAPTVNNAINGLGVIHRQPRVRLTTSNIRGGVPLPLRRTRGGSMLAP